LPARKALFDRFGGLPETTVWNTEWLRKRIERGMLLSIRRGKRVYSHPLLAL
jgi:hypothetical protein